MSTMTKEQYADSIFAEDELLQAVKQSIRDQGMPEISVASGYGRLLTLLVRMSGAKRVLEIGALGGYSGICLARGLNKEGRLISLELKQKFADVAKVNVDKAGFADQVEYRIGEALDSLEQLNREGQTFDFFFIDADKGNYPNYLDWALRLGNKGAIILGDNALMNGKTMDPAEQAGSVQAMRVFIKRTAEDPRLDSSLLPAYDGLVIGRIKQ